jgi:3-hydroxyisobutyrate dehydrogenase
MHYGFIGLGNLGGKLAQRLIGAAIELTVFDLDAGQVQQLVSKGAHGADSAASLAATVDHVITCLPSPEISGAVLAEILGAMRPGASLIEMSTISREDALRFSEMAASAGVGFLELPVTGGVHLAARGELTLLAGGPEALLDIHRPALNAMGNTLFHMGAVGSASLIKVITNMLAFIHLQACGEALMLAARGGLDLGDSWRAIAASSGTSFVHETEGQLILNGSYDIGFTMDLALKDLGFAKKFGEALGVSLELAGATLARFEEAKAAYGGGAQSPMIVKLLEDALATPLRAAGFPASLTNPDN